MIVCVSMLSSPVLFLVIIVLHWSLERIEYISSFFRDVHFYFIGFWSCEEIHTKMKLLSLFTYPHMFQNTCFVFLFVILFSSWCHVSLLPEMEIHEAGRKIWVCTWHCWRIRHLRQQYGSVGLPINERIWVSLPKRKKKSIAVRSYQSKQTNSPQRHLDLTILARNTEQVSL